MKLFVSIFLNFVILFSLKAQNDSIYLVSTNKTLTKYKTTDVDSIVFYSNPVTREYNDTMYVHLKNKLVTILPVDLFDTAFYRPIQNPGQYNALYLTAQSCVGYTMANFNYVIQSTNTISASGVCYSTNPLPTVNDMTVAGTAGNGNKNVTLTNLLTDKTYYVRVYYNTGSQVVYSEQVKIRTKPKAAPTINAFYVNPQLGGLPTTNGEYVSQFTSFWAEINENGSTGSTYSVIQSTNPNNSYLMQFNTRNLSCSTGKETVTVGTSGVMYDFLKGSNSVSPVIKTVDNQQIVGSPFFIGNLAGITSDISNITVECQTSTSAYITFSTNLYQFNDNGILLTSSSGNPKLYPFSNSVSLNNGKRGIMINNLQTNVFYNVNVYGKILGSNNVYVYSLFGNNILTTPTIGGTASISNVYSSNNSISAIGSVCTGEVIIEKGFCYSASQIPTINDNKKVVTSSDFVFNATISGLTGGISYYIRTYVTTLTGTYYSNAQSVTIAYPQPVVATLDPSNIAPTSITANGNLISTSGAPNANRGFRYRLSTGNIYYGVTAGAGGVGAFSANITGLVYGQTYEITAYADNGSGTVYGTPVLVQLPMMSKPTIITKNLSVLQNGGVNVSGEITNTGGGPILSKGICYGTSSTPTITNSSYILNSSSNMAFAQYISSLVRGTKYYFRAFATNAAGTSYGEEIEFIYGAPYVIYSSSVIDFESINIVGEILDFGSSLITERGFCYSTTEVNPSISNSNKRISTWFPTTTTFSSTISGLQSNTTYYVRVYALNNEGVNYSAVLQLTTKAYQLPTVTTLPATNITYNSAKLNLNVINNDGTALTSGVYFTTDRTLLENKNYTSNFVVKYQSNLNATQLTGRTEYYFQAYANNTAGTAYGEILTFITLDPIIPIVTTQGVASLQYNNTYVYSPIVNSGGLELTEQGIVVSKNNQPTINDTKYDNPVATPNYYTLLSNLNPNTTYYFRGYAINSLGVGYGEILTLTTPSAPFLINTRNAQNISVGSIRFICEVYYPAIINSYGVCYSTTPNPTIDSDKTTGVNVNGVNYWMINNIIPSTTYYYRAYYINDTGEVIYGTEYSIVSN